MMIGNPFCDFKKARSPTFRGLVFATKTRSKITISLSHFPAKMTLVHSRELFVYWKKLVVVLVLESKGLYISSMFKIGVPCVRR